jgi:hypothetical protein
MTSMSGKIIHALPLTIYDIGSTLVHGDSLTFTAGREIDVCEYREASLIVRLHSFYSSLTGATGPSWRVQALLSAFTAEDEKAQFAGASVADIGVQQQGPNPPAALVQPFTTPFGSAVRVVVTLAQGSGTALVCTLGISVEIVGKC